MRETCLMCVKKHLAQAIVLCREARTDYPIHQQFAVGHLAEAEEEIEKEYPKLAYKIRVARFAVSADVHNSDQIVILLKEICENDG